MIKKIKEKMTKKIKVKKKLKINKSNKKKILLFKLIKRKLEGKNYKIRFKLKSQIKRNVHNIKKQIRTIIINNLTLYFKKINYLLIV